MSTTNNLGLFKHDNPATNTNQFDVDKALNQNWDKIDTEVGNVKTRLTTLETDNTTNKKDILNIKEKNTEQDKYISELESENARLREDLSGLPSGQVSGESIDISDSADMRFSEFKISGNSKQDGEPISDTPIEVKCCGDNINIFDKDTVIKNYYVNKDDGTLVSNNSNNASDYIKISSEYVIIQNATNNAYYALYDSNKTFLKGGQYKNNVAIDTKNTSYIRFSLNKSMDLSKVKLEKGIITTPYSPYGQGCINEVICNKNIAKINVTYWELTINKTIKNKATNNGVVLSTFIAKKGQTIKVNFKLLSKPTGSTSFSIYKNSEQLDIKFLNIQNYTLNKIYTLEYVATEDCTLKIQMWGNANSDIFEFQFWAELDDVTEYTEHQEQTYTIPTQQPFRAIGDIRDTFVKADGKWYERHYIKEYEFTGADSDAYYFNADNDNTLAVNLHPNNERNIAFKYASAISAYCNKFEYGNLISDKEQIYITGAIATDNGYYGNIRLYLSKTRLKSYSESLTTTEKVDLVKEWLKDNPFIVNYISREPVDIECTTKQSAILDKIEKEAKTYKNITHIYSTDEVSANVDVTYKKDIETLIGSGV